MRRLLARLERFARTEETVVLLGETGTGKTALARWLHEQSPRAAHDFHHRTLAGMDDGIAGAELFGYVQGAFTDAKGSREGAFAAARSGTLLLDEVGKSTLGVQGKLLDVIERRVYAPLGTCREVRLTARLVFAASERLEEQVARGSMLADFLPRLGLFSLVIPPLREHVEDIPVLVEAMVRRHAPRFGYPALTPPQPTPALLDALAAYRWPHNVRELDSLVCRLLLDARSSNRPHALDVSLLTDDLSRFNASPLGGRARRPSPEDIQEALRLSDGKKNAAAKRLGIGRTSLYRLLPRSGNIESA